MKSKICAMSCKEIVLVFVIVAYGPFFLYYLYSQEPLYLEVAGILLGLVGAILGEIGIDRERELRKLRGQKLSPGDRTFNCILLWSGVFAAVGFSVIILIASSAQLRITYLSILLAGLGGFRALWRPADT